MSTYLFDFDGTLVDSMPTYVSTMLAILDEFEIPYGDDVVRIITPLGTEGTAKYFRDLGVPLSLEEIFERMARGMIEAYTYHIPPKEHVLETVRALRERGDDLYVLTASPHITLDPCLKRLGIFDLFTRVWSCDDFSTTKADPEIYKKAAEAMGQPVDRVLFLDDNVHADATAKKAGMKVCGVFDASSASDEEKMRALCDFYIRDFFSASFHRILKKRASALFFCVVFPFLGHTEKKKGEKR
ncbi:MAG: HAD-IA family hydrolase [Clostridia bacterium]|nr:HAD-IA family hydrolase [Clostridia bacterium]